MEEKIQQPQRFFGITKITGSLRSTRMTSSERSTDGTKDLGRDANSAEQGVEQPNPERKRVYDFRGTYPVYGRYEKKSRTT